MKSLTLNDIIKNIYKWNKEKNIQSIIITDNNLTKNHKIFYLITSNIYNNMIGKIQYNIKTPILSIIHNGICVSVLSEYENISELKLFYQNIFIQNCFICTNKLTDDHNLSCNKCHNRICLTCSKNLIIKQCPFCKNDIEKEINRVKKTFEKY